MEAKFSNRCEYEDMIKPLVNSTKVTVRCEYNCDCYKVPLDNELFICETTESITRQDIFDCLVKNGYYTKCNHNFFEDVFVVSNQLVIPLFGK
jgi:hypothetical protein